CEAHTPWRPAFPGSQAAWLNRYSWFTPHAMKGELAEHPSGAPPGRARAQHLSVCPSALTLPGAGLGDVTFSQSPARQGAGPTLVRVSFGPHPSGWGLGDVTFSQSPARQGAGPTFVRAPSALTLPGGAWGMSSVSQSPARQGAGPTLVRVSFGPHPSGWGL